MIGNGKRSGWRPQGSPSITKPFKSLWAGYFMDKMPIDVDQTSAVLLLMHNMRIPDFIKQGFWSRHKILLIIASKEIVS
jgi:hypothetical protein